MAQTTLDTSLLEGLPSNTTTFLRGDGTWAAAGGGQWTHVNTSATFWDGSAGIVTKEYTGLTSGKVYKFVFEDIELNTTSKAIHARFGYGSTTYDTSSGYYYAQRGEDSNNAGGDTSSTSATAIPIAGGGHNMMGGTRNVTHAGVMYLEVIFRTGTGDHTQAYPTIFYNGGTFTSSGYSMVHLGAGMNDAVVWDTNPTTAIKFYTSDESSTFVDGRIIQYELAN